MATELNDVLAAAKEELRQEEFKAAVAKEKIRLKTKRPLLHILFPFVIHIKRRK